MFTCKHVFAFAIHVGRILCGAFELQMDFGLAGHQNKNLPL